MWKSYMRRWRFPSLPVLQILRPHEDLRLRLRRTKGSDRKREKTARSWRRDKFPRILRANSDELFSYQILQVRWCKNLYTIFVSYILLDMLVKLRSLSLTTPLSPLQTEVSMCLDVCFLHYWTLYQIGLCGNPVFSFFRHTL